MDSTYYITSEKECQEALSTIRARKLIQMSHLQALSKACDLAGKSDSQKRSILECSSFVKVQDGKAKVLNLCKNRVCTICAQKKSSKVFGETMRMMSYLNATYDMEYIFLTVSVKNVSKSELPEEITKLNKSYKRFYESKAFKRFSRGNIKNLEITYNEEKDTYHAHIHSIIAVDDDYFVNAEKYTSQSELRQLWERSARLDYYSQVYIERIKGEPEHSVAEVSKYATKLSDIYQINGLDKQAEVIATFMTATKNRRLHTLSGRFKEAAAKCKKADELAESFGSETFFEWDSKSFTFKERF